MLGFWLPFRALKYESPVIVPNSKKELYIKQLKIDFGGIAYNKEQLEEQLGQKFNKIEIREVGGSPNTQNQEIENLELAMDESELFDQDYMRHLDDTLEF